MTIHGVDVSVYQGLIDYDKLATKAQFVIIRAASAKNQDALLERNVTEAKRTARPWGLYCVPIPNTGTRSWQIQAQLHADLVNLYGGQIYPAIDLENDGGFSKNDLNNWLTKYIKSFAEYTDRAIEKIITYTRAGWFDWEMPLTDVFWHTLLWAADYTPPLQIPREWSNHSKTAIIHQTGIYKPATDYGCPAPPAAAYGIDINEFLGDAARFTSLFGVAPGKITQPPAPPPPEPGTMQFKVIVPTLNIREGPAISFNDVGDLHAGDIVTAIDIGGSYAWAKLDDRRWACIQKDATRYMVKV